MTTQYFDPAQVDSDQKDLIISQLKADVFELKQNEKDYQDIRVNLNNLEHRHVMLQEEKVKNEKKKRCCFFSNLSFLLQKKERDNY